MHAQKRAWQTRDAVSLFLVCNSDSNITVGFAQPSYTIREDGGNISVCLDVDVVQLLTGVITVQIMTVDVTAIGKTINACINFAICMLVVSATFYWFIVYLSL